MRRLCLPSAFFLGLLELFHQPKHGDPADSMCCAALIWAMTGYSNNKSVEHAGRAATFNLPVTSGQKWGRSGRMQDWKLVLFVWQLHSSGCNAKRIHIYTPWPCARGTELYTCRPMKQEEWSADDSSKWICQNVSFLIINTSWSYAQGLWLMWQQNNWKKHLEHRDNMDFHLQQTSNVTNECFFYPILLLHWKIEIRF